MAKKGKVNHKELIFLYFHGWSRKELAEKFNCGLTSIDYHLKGLTLGRQTSVEDHLDEKIKATKERIEFLLKRNFTLEHEKDTIIELLRGLNKLITIKFHRG